MSSRFKVIVSGEIIEVYSYTISIKYGQRPPPEFDPETGEVLTEAIEPKERSEDAVRSAFSARRARMELRRLILANFDSRSKFITLTFKENITDVQEANKEYSAFIKRLKRIYGSFKYCTVIEFQMRGAVHYHMISDLPYIKKKELAEIWGNGFVRINDIEHVDNVGAYVTAYMTKELTDKRLNGKKAYFTSRNLIRPTLYRGAEAIDIIAAYKLKKRKAVFTNSYESEYCGTITYNEYNLNRDPMKESSNNESKYLVTSNV